MKAKYAHLYSTFLPKPNRLVTRLRLALTLGVKAAKHDWLIFTDIHTPPPSPQWLNELSAFTTGSTSLLLGYINRKTGDVRLQPFDSVGEARPARGPGRREIGHGALAERALVPVIPSEEEFPYTLRLVSEVLESNGSSSMGSVCGSTMSLMHAGVPIKRPVSGVAMGLVKDGDAYTILTDIQGMEDALGDMDFKVAGTERGITAIQMDIKIAGITREILASALEQAKRGRAFILGKMLECIPKPNEDLSPYAPRVTTMHISVDKIRNVIGPGGKIIKKIVEDTNTQIDIEEDGTVHISAVSVEDSQKAIEIIKELTRDVEVGATYRGRVTRIMGFGAFVEVLPGKEGLCHISQLSKRRVEKVEDVVKIGDEIDVKVTEIDRQGRVNLSHKALLV